MSYRFLAYVIAPALVGAGLVGINAASAHGLGMGFGKTATPDQIAEHQTLRFQEEAELLGVSVDEIKAAWAKGQSLPQLMEEKGVAQTEIDAKLKARREAHRKTQLDALVAKGVITQAQADERLQSLETMPAPGNRGGHMGGMMKGLRGGFGPMQGGLE